MQRKVVFVLLLLLVPCWLGATTVVPAAQQAANPPMADLINAGLKVMALGMLFVFAFLVIMVVCISFTSFLFKTFGRSEQSGTELEDGVPKAHVAAISAAVSAWMKRR